MVLDKNEDVFALCYFVMFMREAIGPSLKQLAVLSLSVCRNVPLVLVCLFNQCRDFLLLKKNKKIIVRDTLQPE